MVSPTDLRAFAEFEHVPDEQLQWLIDRATEITYPANETLGKPGERIDQLRLLLDGKISIVGSDTEDLIEYKAPAILGLLPYSRLTEANRPVVTDTPARTLNLHRDQLRELTSTCYELTEALVQQMTDRVRSFTRQAQQEEKMASLGRLSAGLAHELNNPVSAIVRNADALKQHMRATPEQFKAIMHLKLTDAQTDTINEWLFDRLDNKRAPLSLLERNSLEDDLTDWLDDHQVHDAADVASSLVAFHFSEGDLDFLLEQVGSENLVGVLNWIDNNLITEKLVVDMGDASGRMAALVSSIKAHTHMDRGGGREPVQIREGIQSTLTLLGHKLRAKNIAVSLQFSSDLPPIQAWPGELNQVWTNLIDNAIDALPEQGGTLTIGSHVEREQFLYTTFTDNGSGVPDEIQQKVFEPFFTTKGVGKGTGLGLDLVQGIVRHHNGSVTLQSKPGETTFTVCLPMNE